MRFDAERDFARIRAKVLYVLSRTDKLFPPSIAPGVMDKLAAAGVRRQYFEIDTELGHVGQRPGVGEVGARPRGLPREARHLKITEIETIPLRLPFAQPFRISQGADARPSRP